MVQRCAFFERNSKRNQEFLIKKKRIHAKKNKRVLIDGSRIMIESCVNAGAEVFVSYPVTPTNYLYHFVKFFSFSFCF